MMKSGMLAVRSPRASHEATAVCRSVYVWMGMGGSNCSRCDLHRLLRLYRPLPRLRGRDREGAPLAHARAASPSPPSPASGGGSAPSMGKAQCLLVGPQMPPVGIVELFADELAKILAGQAEDVDAVLLHP